MVEPGNDFDDFQDDDLRQPLLPQEDRLWRHPSELGASSGAISPDQALAARRRWMAATPSRAGAGAAGLVGALLAAGVVLIGTHLTAWLTPHHDKAATSLTARREDIAATTAVTVTTVSTDGLATLSTEVSRALVRVRAVHGSGTEEADGVLISSDGYVAVPSAVVDGATSVSVIPSNGEELVATTTGTDSQTGIAVLHVVGSGFPFVGLSPVRDEPAGSFVLLAWRGSALQLKMTTMSPRSDVTSLGNGPALLWALPPSVGLGGAPDGALIVDGQGEVAGMVASRDKRLAVVAPGWLVARVARDLISKGHVTYGWLGIDGAATQVSSLIGLDHANRPSATRGAMASADEPVRGVRVLAVQPKGPAAEAGLEQGDVIEAVDGQPVSNMSALRAVLYVMNPTSSVKLEVERGQQLSEVSAQLQPAA